MYFLHYIFYFQEESDWKKPSDWVLSGSLAFYNNCSPEMVRYSVESREGGSWSEPPVPTPVLLRESWLPRPVDSN